MVIINSTNLMAQCTMPFSVGGTVSGNSQSSEQKSSETIKSSGNQQISGCIDDEPPMEEVVVYGHVTRFSWGFIRFWWSPSPGGNGGSGGSGNGNTSFGDVAANKECQALGAGKRQDLANLAFKAARLLAFKTDGLQGRKDFDEEHAHGTVFELTLANGAIIRMIVSQPGATIPLITEASNSCG